MTIPIVKASNKMIALVIKIAKQTWNVANKGVALHALVQQSQV